jgi:curli biogenesis system outer membrane secretion channel CsgG
MVAWRDGRRPGRRHVALALGLLLLGEFAETAAVFAQSSGAPALTTQSYEGPKTRLAVLRFEIRPPTASAVVGDGLADMLAGALLGTNRYLIGGRGPVDLVVLGVLTEFTPAGVASGEAARVSMELRLLDAKTSRVLASGPARGRASDTTALGAPDQLRLGAGLTAYAGTSLEKAIRQAVQSGVRVIVAATTTEYLRHVETAARPPAPTEAAGPLPPLTVSPDEPARSVATTPPAAPTPAPPAPAPRRAPPPPALRRAPPPPAPRPVPPPAAAVVIGMRFVKTPTANLRDAGSSTGRIFQSLPRGTRLEVLETKAGWHRVRIPDGRQGWLADSVTSPTPP